MKKNKKILYLLVLFVSFFGIGMIQVKAVCADGSPGCGILDDKDNGDNGGSGGSSGGACIKNSLCSNSGFIMLQTEVVHMDTAGKQVYDTYYYTNDPSRAGGNVIYASWMTKEPYAYGVAADQLNSYLSANNYAATRELLARSGITNFVGSTNGSDAYGLLTQAMVQYKTSSGALDLMTLKDYASIATNKSRALELLSRITTGYDDVLKYINGTDQSSCQGMSLALAASPLSGCGLNIIDIACLLGVVQKKPAPSCPGGSMSVTGDIGECYPKKGGVGFGFSNLAGAGGRQDIHRNYGQEKAAVGEYCSLYCQEYGTATLPGETGEALALGSYIIWPTSNKNYNNNKFQKDYYPLTFEGKLYCKLAVLPDPNMPGANGRCFNDPIASYTEEYKIIEKTWNKKDYTKQIYEDVRKRHIGRTKSPASVCKGNYDQGGKSCGMSKKVGGGEGGTDPFQCLTPLEKAIPIEEKALLKIEKELRAAEQAYNAQPASCPEPIYSTVNGKRTQTGTKDPCPPRKAALLAALNAVRARYERQIQVIKRQKQALEEVKSAIQTCTQYTKAFELDCDILQAMHKCGIYQVTADIYDFKSSVSMQWADKEYSTGDVSKVDSSKSVTKQGQIVYIPEGDMINDVSIILAEAPAVFTGQVNQIKANEYEVTAKDKYTLETPYRYIDKNKLTYKTNTSGLKNYIDITKEENSVSSVIPTSYNNDVGVSYDLTLTGIKFGSSMSNFGNGSRYVCKQKFTKSSDVCTCPENSKHPGKELGGLICDTKETCVDAQEKYCNLDYIPDYAACDAYCDEPMDNISLSACINAGFTRSECVSKICPNITEPIKCKNSNGVGGTMDITACVETKMMQGKTKQQAIDECDSLICPIGKFIIYRTIRLENPFPGKDISGIAKNFNNEVIGRYPGYNWNSVSTVSTKIRNNRGVSGTTIYQQKEPLYSFVLTGINIEKIRDYNKKQKEGYNDFTLECKNNKSSGCVSYVFVHNQSLSGLVSGTCRSISLDNGFYTCVNR